MVKLKLPFRLNRGSRLGELPDSTVAGSVALGNLAMGGSIPETVLSDREQDGLVELRRELHYPFSVPYVTERLYKMAKAINEHLAEYDLVIREQVSGELPGQLFAGLASARRKELGLPPAETRGINGRFKGEVPPGYLPVPSSEGARTLIVSEYANTGDSVMRVYEAVATQRSRGSIDVLVLDASIHTLQLDEGSRFFRFHHGGVGASTERYFTMNSHAKDATGLIKNPDDLHAHPDPNLNATRVAEAQADIIAMTEAFYTLLPRLQPVTA